MNSSAAGDVRSDGRIQVPLHRECVEVPDIAILPIDGGANKSRLAAGNQRVLPIDHCQLLKVRERRDCERDSYDDQGGQDPKYEPRAMLNGFHCCNVLRTRDSSSVSDIADP